MTKQVQRRRGTATQHTSFTGAEGELSVNTTNKSVHVHDNVTAGGFEAARADMDNVTSSSILTAAGITATTAELNYVDGVTSAIQTQLDGKAGTASPTFTGTLTTANLTATGTTTLAGASTSADITFGDSDKAVFGAGSDLQIYHSGTHSFIDDAGQGNLYVRGNSIQLGKYTGEIGLKVQADDAVTLYYDNSQKLATTSTGIDVTGTVTADGVILGNNDKLIFQDSGGTNRNILHFDTGNNIIIGGAGAGVNDITLKNNGAKDRLKVGVNGDISFYEDTGTTPKMVWSASAESLSVGSGGTATPAANLIINDSAASGFKAKLTSSAFNVDGNWLGLGMGYNNGYMKSAIIAEAKDGNARTNLHFALDSDVGSGNVGLADAKVTITYDGNVGIGTSSPSYPLTVAGKISYNGAIGEGADNTLSSSSTTLILGESSTWQNLSLRTNGSEAMRIDSSGHAIIPAGVTLGTSAGVYNAANTLDDYEEGTWTPTSVNSGTLTFTRAYYTKIGRQVTLQLENIKFSDTTSGTNLAIGGLPFASGLVTAAGPAMFSFRDNNDAITAFIPQSAAEIRFYLNSGTTSFQRMQHDMFSSSSAAIYMTITYFTT